MNYDPVEVVIDLTVRTFRLRDWQYDIEEIVEDLAEALKLIGAAKIYEDKVALLKFNSNYARLPLDCQHIKGPNPSGQFYKESGSFVQMDVPDGAEVAFEYQAMPVDARGYILIPDAVEVRKALMWYLVVNLTLQGEITRIPYGTAEMEWQWRCGSARAVLNVWSVQDASRAYNDFTRLNPIKDQHAKNYSNVGQPNSLDRNKNADRFNRNN